MAAERSHLPRYYADFPYAAEDRPDGDGCPPGVKEMRSRFHNSD